MSTRRVLRFVLAAGLALAAALAFRAHSVAKTTAEDLGGPRRYLTHVSTDKPIYRTGESVYIRAVLLDAIDHTPLPEDEQARAFVEIKGPKGDAVASGHVASHDSVVGFRWPVPDGQAGGEYTIKVTYPWQGHAPAERKFDIRAYRPPRLKSQIVFLRDGYGPGDDVGATLHVERAEGGVPQGAKVTAIARVDGQEVHRGDARVDGEGNCTVDFQLPQEIERGEGTLALVIEDGGVVETAAKTIPILLQTVDIEVFPEGGDLVAGLPCRVYLEAKRPDKKPADIAGRIVDAQGRLATTFRTEHEGRGRFSFIPRKDGEYTLQITEPAGIQTTYPLPPVRPAGAVIRALQNRTPSGQPVRLRAGSTEGGKLTVTLTHREVEVSSATWDALPGVLADVVLAPPAGADGVLIATLWDAEGAPLAERLVYRQPAESLKIAVRTEKSSYVPGEKVKLTVQTTDAEGQPVGAVVGLTVADDSVLEMIETREQAPRLLPMVFLEPEVRELADAHVYLDESDPEAPLALDLLLGTQGWRRFAFVDPAEFLKDHGDKARRVLALRMATRREELRAKGGRMNRGAARLGFAGAEGAAEVDAAMPAAPPEAEPQAAAPPEKAPAPADEKAELRKELKDILEKRARKQEEALVAEEPMAELRADRARRLRRTSFVPVRVYAHQARPDRQPNDRVDFTETLYWNAGVKTDPQTGEATVEFALSDSVTTFRVFADAFSSAGVLGQGTGVVESVEPFYIEPKLPLAVTAGDVIELPVSVVNALESGLGEVTLVVTADGELAVEDPEAFELGPEARERRVVRIKVGHLRGKTGVVLEAKAGPYADKVTRPLRVEPRGFPVEVGFGGITAADSSFSHTVAIPQGVVPRSVTTEAAVYPTPLANLTEALERLIRDPHGCFEQTSSTNYPLVMAQQYFLSHTGVDPELVAASREKLEEGYKRLVSFECKEKGYEWFGSDPGHEALTAYGLLEFSDMAEVREVDPSMIERTRKWLLARRDGEGGFKRNPRALDSFGRAPEPTTNAYIVWALLEAGQKDIDKEVEAAIQSALDAEDSYVVALGANIAALAGQDAAARKLMDKLAKAQHEDGFVDGALTSITRSGGQALRIETTSLAVLAWLRDAAYAGAVEKAMHYIAESCKAGRFGSTQSTVLALRAIVAYDKRRARPKAPGTVRIHVDGQPVGDPVPFQETTKGAIELPDVSELLSPGEHTIELRMADGGAMPYSLAVRYHNLQPPSAQECKVGLQVALSDAQLDEGTVTEANVTVTNRADEALPLTVAIVGVPGGLEPRHDQLKELAKAGRIAAYEVIGRDVVLYWRQMRAGQTIELPISLVAAVPGTYTGPASRAYLYYTDEFKTWTKGLQVAIRPRAGQ
ncbi:MAG: MG2 domain-containing protein [Candidatus Brocadiia bacterium]